MENTYTNDVREEIVALRGELVARIDAKRGDVARLSKVRTFIAGKAEAAARVELELLEEWLDEAGKRARRGDFRTAILALKGGLGDKAARRACQHYGTDAMLAAAEAREQGEENTPR